MQRLNDDKWRLLEEYTFNGITILAYYNGELKQSGILLFNYEKQPNELSKKSPNTHWGFVTHCVFNMHTLSEVAEVFGLYLKDIENENLWWEKDL
jgi:hypothetical protein